MSAFATLTSPHTVLNRSTPPIVGLAIVGGLTLYAMTDTTEKPAPRLKRAVTEAAVKLTECAWCSTSDRAALTRC